MRYALISDIHGNLPALEAVLANIDRQPGVDAMYHLGDLVGYAPWPNEVVDLVRARSIPGVSGNYDSTVASDYKHCGCRYEDPRQEQLSHESFAWTKAHVLPATRAALAALPFRLDARPLGGHTGGPTVILVHGAPTLNTLYWTVDRPGSFRVQMAELAGARPGDVLAFGHTHVPWRAEAGGVHFVNTGSVGRPKDGDWRAGYVILDVEQGRVGVQVIRVEYDIDRVVQAILASGLPHDFAMFLRSGGRLPPVTPEAGSPS